MVESTPVETARLEASERVIDGSLAPGSSGETFAVYNPSTEEEIGRAPVAGPDDIDAAVRSSYRAFQTWRETPAADRAAVMMKLLQAVRANIDSIGRVLTNEKGKTFPHE